MMSTVSEAQKKQIMLLLAAFITILIFISGIRPTQAKITVNEALLSESEAKRNEMQIVVENRKIETDYVTLREEYEVKFQQRFENFRSNEKIENITTALSVPIQSIRIKDFEPVKTTIYEKYVAQPKTVEQLQEAQKDENSPVFPLLLCSQVDLMLEIDSLEEELKMYDAFNNIVPVGPGEADPDRYCILIPTMNLRKLPSAGKSISDRGNKNVSYTIFVFAMETMDLTVWDAEFEARKQVGS